MNRYGMVAIEATNELRKNKNINPVQAWEEAAMRIFSSISSRNKNCPKATFLSLCEMGFIKGVKSDRFTKSKKNKEYASVAIEYIKNNCGKEISKEQLWSISVKNAAIKHNSQMDVVLALYQNEMLEL